MIEWAFLSLLFLWCVRPYTSRPLRLYKTDPVLSDPASKKGRKSRVYILEGKSETPKASKLGLNKNVLLFKQKKTKYVY